MKFNAGHLCLLFNVIFCLSICSSCEKDPEVITNTITIIDTVVITDTVTLIETVIETIVETVPDTVTTFILVRHAETTGGGSNPNLSAAGQTRAAELARILGNVNLNAVYSTNFNRTTQTAQPTASDKSLNITTYDAFAPDALIDNVLLTYAEGNVLVVGHSNTTADMLNVMVGGNTFADIPETEYDNLFVVQVSEKGKSRVLLLKYGE